VQVEIKIQSRLIMKTHKWIIDERYLAFLVERTIGMWGIVRYMNETNRSFGRFDKGDDYEVGC
jgi:hypothetical protein